MGEFQKAIKFSKNNKVTWSIDTNNNFNIYKPQFSNSIDTEKKGLLIFGHGGLDFTEVTKKSTPEGIELHFFVNHGEIALSSMLRAMSCETKTVETLKSGDCNYDYTIGASSDYEIDQYIKRINDQAYFYEQNKLEYYDLLVVKENKRVKLSKLLSATKKQGYKKIYAHTCRGRMFPQIIPSSIRKWLRKKHENSKLLQQIWKLQPKEVGLD